MSPTDHHFLKSLGIKPEEIAPAAKQVGGYKAVYETCPQCAGKRHRFLDNGRIFCLSCDARVQREARQLQALKDATFARVFGQAFQRVNVNYRGFEIAHLNGVGWCYRFERILQYQNWMKANSFEDAQRRVDRICGPEIRSIPDESIVRVVECIECGEPCGPVPYCSRCGKAQS